MKKILSVLAFIAVLLVGGLGSAAAQVRNVDFTVYNGTTTSGYVPVYGYYCDAYLKCEYVIPAEDLLPIEGATISKLTYHLSSPASGAWTGTNFQVFLKEYSNTTISSYSGTDGATIVYEGALDATSSTMEIVFTTPYTYNGGNLLIGFYNTVTGTYKGASFYGQTVTGACVQGNNSSALSSVTATQRNFIPKTTFTVNEITGCLPPTELTVSNITTTTADIAWTAGGSETQWVVSVNDVETTVNSNPYTLTDLTPGTVYTVKVKSVCDATHISGWATSASFATECVTYNVTEETPYVQDFESTDFPPTCWSRAHTAGTSSSQWVRTTSSSYVHAGSGAAQLQDQQAGNRNDLVTGMLNIPTANDYRVSFWMYRSNYSSLKENEGIKVWVNTTPDTIGATEIAYIHRQYTLTPVEEVVGWYQYTAEIPTAGDMYVIFQGISEYGQASYIDDIAVEAIPACLPPTALAVSNITTNTADLSWTAAQGETAWVISVNDVEIPVTENPYTLTELTPATAYTVMVKGVCSEDDSSAYGLPVDFITECEVFNVTAETPYVEGFEGTTFPPTCWSRAHTAGTATSQWVRTTYASGIHSGDGAAQLQDQAAGNRNDLVTGMLNIPAANAFQVSFWVYRSHYSSLKENEGIKVWVNTTPDTIGATEIGYIHRQYTLSPVENAIGWYQYTCLIPNEGDMYVVFQGISEYGLSTYMDDISVEIAPTCFVPTDLAVSQVTANSAVISWTANTEETSWNLSVNDVETVVTENPYTLTGLTSSTSYTVMVQAICSEDDQSAYTLPVDFTTECETMVVTNANPFVEDFEGTGIPACWSVDAENSAYGWTVGVSSQTTYSSVEPYSGEHYAIFLGNSSAGYIADLITPVLDITALTNPSLSFAYIAEDWGGDQNDLNVYYRTSAAAEWQLLASYNTSVSDWSEQVIALPEASATYQVSFQGVANYGYGILLDAVTIAGESCVVPTELTATNATENSVDLSWTAGGEETAWNVQYRAQGEEEWTIVLNVTNPYTLTGLDANTTYEIQVQAVCSEDATSEWSDTVVATTEEEVVTPCAVPTDITVENNVATWTSEAASFNIVYIVGADTTTVDGVQGNTYTFTEIEEGTEVAFAVQAICDEDNTSDMSEFVTFTTVGISNYTINANVYPNPTTGMVNVECSAINANISVYDMFGKLMMTSTIQNERTELNLSGFAPGMYMIRIADANTTTNVKIVKE